MPVITFDQFLEAPTSPKSGGGGVSFDQFLNAPGINPKGLVLGDDGYTMEMQRAASEQYAARERAAPQERIDAAAKAGLPGIAPYAEAIRPYLPDRRKLVKEAMGLLEGSPVAPEARSAEELAKLGAMGIRGAGKAASTLAELGGSTVQGTADLLSGGGRLIASPFKNVADRVSTALGSGVRGAEKTAAEAQAAAEAANQSLRSTVVAPVAKTAEAANLEAAAAQKRLDALAQARAQLAERDAQIATPSRPGELPQTVAEQRAARQAGAGGTMQDVRENALSKFRERLAAVRARVRGLGGSEQEAVHAAEAAETATMDARQAAEAYSENLLSRPSITPEAFGLEVRGIVQNIHAKAIEAREQTARFGQAVESAGNERIVQTQDVMTYIDEALGKTRNPEIENALKSIRSRLENTETVGKETTRIQELTLEQADSLRKYLNQVISSKRITLENGGQGSVSAAIRDLTNVRNTLMTAAGDAHPPYRTAVETWARLSEPVREFTGKGSLRKFIQTDLQSREDLLGSADVVGELLRQAKAGKPVITSLVARNPELVNSARMYFNRELFRGQAAPSVARLDSFLKSNENALRQLNLYEEFQTIAGAKAAGEKAVKIAENAARAAKAEVTAAGKDIRRALSAETQATRTVGAQEKRVIAAAPAETAEGIAADRAARAARAETQLGIKTAQTEKTLAQAENRRTNYQALLNQIEKSTPTGAVAKSKEAANKMFKDGVINSDEHRALLSHIQETSDKMDRVTATAANVLTAKEARVRAQRDLAIAVAALASGGTGGFLTLGRHVYHGRER